MQGAQSDSRFRGIGRYTLSFVRALVKVNNEHEILLVLNGGLRDSIESIREQFYDVLPYENIRIWYPISPTTARDEGNEWRHKISELIREAFIQSLRPDVIYLSSLFEGYVDNSVTGINEFIENGVPQCVSFYDLIPLIFPAEYLNQDKRFEKFYRFKLEQLKKFKLLLGISSFTTQQAIEYLGLSQHQVVNISAAVGSDFSFSDANQDLVKTRLIALEISKSFILFVGGGDLRKNLSRLIRAYLSFPSDIKESNSLVIVGPNIKKEDFVNLIPRIDFKKVIFLGHVTNEDLKILYSACQLFIFPSIYEGFGLPALEAMHCGAPVIASNTSSIPEVVGFEPALFDPMSVDDISNKMLEVITDKDFRNKLIDNAHLRVHKFSWDETAKLAINEFEKLHLNSIKNLDSLIYKSENIYELLIKRIAEVTTQQLQPTDNDLLQCALSIGQTLPSSNRKKKFYVDISELAQRDARTGIQRVVRSILNELLKNSLKDYETVFIYGNTTEVGYRIAKKYINKVLNLSDSSDEDNFIEPESGDIFLGLDLQHHTTRIQASFLKEMRIKGIKTYFVIYDLLPIQFPEFWPSEHKVTLIHEEWLKVVCQSNGVICISETVAQDLKDWIRINKIHHPRNLEIHWFHLGADIDNSIPSKGLPKDCELVLSNLNSRDTFLIVGTIEPRKGCEEIFNAFIELWMTGVDINLVFVGKQGWMVEKLISNIINHTEYNQRLFWLNGISDEYLEKVYESSTCLIAASFGEGFGLPLIEAAQHDLPIIARDIPIFREVAGNHAYFYQSYGYKDMADIIKKWLKIYKSGNHVSSSSMQWITWSKSTKMLMKIIGAGERYD